MGSGKSPRCERLQTSHNKRGICEAIGGTVALEHNYDNFPLAGREAVSLNRG